MSEKKKNPVGRPSELLETLEKAKEYLYGGYEKFDEVIPSIAGLACYAEVGASRSRITQVMTASNGAPGRALHIK